MHRDVCQSDAERPLGDRGLHVDEEVVVGLDGHAACGVVADEDVGDAARFDGVAGLGDDFAAAFEGFVACSGGRKGDCTGGCRGEEKECLFHGVIGLCRFRMLRV